MATRKSPYTGKVEPTIWDEWCRFRSTPPQLANREDQQPCIGGGRCGRTTNGYFEVGSHGPGWYCGWCEAVPGGRS